MSFVVVMLGTKLLSNRPVTVMVSALVSPRSTLPLATKLPPAVTFPVTLRSLAIVLPIVIAPNVAAPSTTSVPSIFALPSTCSVAPRTLPVATVSPRNRLSPLTSTLPLPLGSKIMFKLVSSVVIVLPVSLSWLGVSPPSSL